MLAAYSRLPAILDSNLRTSSMSLASSRLPPILDGDLRHSRCRWPPRGFRLSLIAIASILDAAGIRLDSGNWSHRIPRFLSRQLCPSKPLGLRRCFSQHGVFGRLPFWILLECIREFSLFCRSDEYRAHGHNFTGGMLEYPVHCLGSRISTSHRFASVQKRGCAFQPQLTPCTSSSRPRFHRRYPRIPRSLPWPLYQHKPHVCIDAEEWLCLPAAADNLNESSISFAAAMDIELRSTIPLVVCSNTPFTASAVVSAPATGLHRCRRVAVPSSRS
jgi:hypothetical protein